MHEGRGKWRSRSSWRFNIVGTPGEPVGTGDAINEMLARERLGWWYAFCKLLDLLLVFISHILVELADEVSILFITVALGGARSVGTVVVQSSGIKGFLRQGDRTVGGKPRAPETTEGASLKMTKDESWLGWQKYKQMRG
jgi:hypothetical protein